MKSFCGGVEGKGSVLMWIIFESLRYIVLSLSIDSKGLDGCCRDFVAVCGLALDLNARLIASDQYEYQEAMRTNFREMAARLSTLFGEQVREKNMFLKISEEFIKEALPHCNVQTLEIYNNKSKFANY